MKNIYNIILAALTAVVLNAGSSDAQPGAACVKPIQNYSEPFIELMSQGHKDVFELVADHFEQINARVSDRFMDQYAKSLKSILDTALGNITTLAIQACNDNVSPSACASAFAAYMTGHREMVQKTGFALVASVVREFKDQNLTVPTDLSERIASAIVSMVEEHDPMVLALYIKTCA
ncbi:hypothetical protein [Pseudosulfitobacter sp. DSM 107133]|uniref:hypothetical protein n=1 Tax=Pseudosulfitobacter sp. DSM 107133 TaxID=2883100 RepID=UPI000DF20036|nr:hypothetical protein [Pseudosulfitobacter sp. DSM 107133]